VLHNAAMPVSVESGVPTARSTSVWTATPARG
jgi:hypothetical protein